MTCQRRGQGERPSQGKAGRRYRVYVEGGWWNRNADEICLLNFTHKVCFGYSDVNICQQQQQQHEQVVGLIWPEYKVYYPAEPQYFHLSRVLDGFSGMAILSCRNGSN